MPSVNKLSNWYDPNDVDVTLASASGSFEANSRPMSGVIIGIRIKPATESTTYDFTITDADGFIPFARTGLKGTYIENHLGIAIRGIFTIKGSNASANEAFTVATYDTGY